MASVARLVLLAAAAVPQANATVGAGGAVMARSEPRAPAVSRRKRRQLVGAIYSQAVPGFDPLAAPWTTVRCPNKQLQPGAAGPKQHVFQFDVESSVTAGKFTRVHVEYGVRAKAARTAAWHLTNTNRAVRVDDGGLGWMVGAGHHQSYAGLIEFFKAADTHGARSPAHAHTPKRERVAGCVHLISLPDDMPAWRRLDSHAMIAHCTACLPVVARRMLTYSVCHART